MENLYPKHGLKGIDYAANRRLRKLRPDEAWATIERLAQYEDEGWNDAFTPDEVCLNYENPDIEQLLGIMERKVDTLMKDAISIRQLEDNMQVIIDEFLEFSSEVTRRLKERIKEKENEPRKIEKFTKYPDTKVLENNAKHDFFESLKKKTFPTLANLLCVRYVRLIHSNPSQPQKNILGFKPGERANLSRHNLSNSLTVQPPTQNDTTFMVNNPIKHDLWFTHFKLICQLFMAFIHLILKKVAILIEWFNKGWKLDPSKAQLCRESYSWVPGKSFGGGMVYSGLVVADLLAFYELV
ncbi:hypothetical protein Tco_0917629 [Tanacetum coccineum]